MSAYCIQVSLLLLLAPSGILGNLRDTCDRNTAREGYLDCVSFPSKYRDSQWAICAADAIINRNGNYKCQAPFCWLPCMRITAGKKRGVVSQGCQCNIADWKTKVKPSLELKCYLPIRKGCMWFQNCLSKYKYCPETDGNSADPFGRYLCNVFDSHSEDLSVRGNQYIRSLIMCLHDEMFHLILPTSNQTCTERTYIAKKSHANCYKKKSLTTMFCNLPVSDQSYIFWTSKSLVVSAFGGSGRSILDSLRNCYRGNVLSEEKQISITVDSVKTTDVQSVVDDFAKVLNWPSMHIVWDGQNINQISNSTKAINILFKPKFDFDFTSNRQLRSTVVLTNEYERIQLNLRKHKLVLLGILAVFLSRTKVEYFSDIEQCPYYDGYGGIFDDYFPESIDKIHVQFVLHQKQNRTETIDYFNDNAIKHSSYDGKKRTYIIIHGFRSNGEEVWIQDMVSALLEQTDCNVIVVDWNNGANIEWSRVILSGIESIVTKSVVGGVLNAAISIAYEYIQAAVNTKIVGCFVGKLIEKLHVLMNTKYNDVHIVGHSLGAHVSGFAGLYTKSQVGRITGLDPAGPAFTYVHSNFRLDKGDGKFVDIIHTDTLSFGIDRSIGHIDFYPNGGSFQPGCRIYGCSHARAHALFTESISPTCNFTACLCQMEEIKNGGCITRNVCTTMGFRVNTNKRGNFFLTTNETSLFCIRNFLTRKRKKRKTEVAIILHQKKTIDNFSDNLLNLNVID